MVKKLAVKVCQVTGCKEPARFWTGRINLNGSKQWLYVCHEHEKLIGNENLIRQGLKERE